MASPPPKPEPARLVRRKGRIRRWWSFHVPIALKLALAITVVVGGCIVLLASLVIQHQHQQLRTQIDDLGHSLAAQMARSAAEPLLAEDRLALGVLVSSLVADENVLGAVVLGPEGQVLAQAGLTPLGSGALAGSPDRVEAERLQGFQWAATDVDNTGQRKLVTFVSPVKIRDLVAGHVVITLNRTPWDRAVRDSIRNVVGASLAVLLLGTLLIIALARKVSQPIHELLHAGRALDAGTFDVRLPEFRNDELGHLMSFFNRFADDLKRKQAAESALARYLSPRLARELLDGGKSERLGGERVEASVIFADIVGFTGMAEGMSPEEVARLLNQYFGHIVRAAEANHGIIDKYIGDCAMVLFGVPQTDPEHRFHAVACALTMRRLIEQENRQREQDGLPPVRFSFGINSGEMLAGNMGAHERMEFTVIGDSVNLASRLASAAEANQVLISEDLYNRPEIRERVIASPHRSIRLRGISRMIRTYLVEDIKPPYREAFERRIEQLWWQSLRRTA